MVCFVGVAVLGVIPGIGLAIAIAIAEFLWDGWRPRSAVLGRAHGVKGYHDITRYSDARRIPGLVLFRWDAPLFFANAEFFKERVLDAVANARGRDARRRDARERDAWRRDAGPDGSRESKRPARPDFGSPSHRVRAVSLYVEENFHDA